LSESLAQVSQLFPEAAADAELGYLRFESVKTKLPIFGYVLQSMGASKRWKLSRSFVAKKLNKLTGIAIDKDGNVVVASWGKGIKVYTKYGEIIGTVYDSHGSPDVAVSTDNRCVFAPISQVCIQCNDMQGNKVFAAPVTGMDNKPSAVNSVAVDLNDRIIVGQTKYTISIHNTDGSLISKFATESMPYRLAITSNKEIVTS
jgi:hypothetical protein